MTAYLETEVSELRREKQQWKKQYNQMADTNARLADKLTTQVTLCATLRSQLLDVTKKKQHLAFAGYDQRKQVINWRTSR